MARTLAYELRLLGLSKQIKGAKDLAKALREVKEAAGAPLSNNTKKAVKDLSDLQERLSKSTVRAAAATRKQRDSYITLSQEVSRAKKQLERIRPTNYISTPINFIRQGSRSDTLLTGCSGSSLRMA